MTRQAILDVHGHLWRTVIDGSRYFSNQALERWAANFGLGGAIIDVDLDGEMLSHALDVAEDDLGAEYRMCAFAIDLRPLFEMEIELSKLNDWVIREAERDQRGRILPFACLNPVYPGAVDEVRRAALQGARGFKLYPPTGFYPDDPEAFSVYEAVIEAQTEVGRTLPMLFHAGFSYSGSKYARPVHLEEIAFRFQPDLRIIAAHAGIPWTDEALWVSAIQDNVYLDIALFGDVVGFWPELHAEFLAKAKRAGALGRVLFGSDWPLSALWLNDGATPEWANLQNVVRAVEHIETPAHLRAAGYPELSDDDLVSLLGRNAVALFDGAGFG